MAELQTLPEPKPARQSKVLLFNGLAGPTALLLNMSRLEKKNLVIGVFTAVLGVGLAIPLVSRWSVLGAAIASCSTMVVTQALRWWMVWRHIGIRCDAFSGALYWWRRHGVHSSVNR